MLVDRAQTLAWRMDSPACRVYRRLTAKKALSIITVITLRGHYRGLRGIGQTPVGHGAFEGSHAPKFSGMFVRPQLWLSA